jgi:hypothetical protein
LISPEPRAALSHSASRCADKGGARQRLPRWLLLWGLERRAEAARDTARARAHWRVLREQHFSEQFRQVVFVFITPPRVFRMDNP